MATHLEICDTCLLALRTGAPAPEMTDAERARWLDRIERRWPSSEGWMLVGDAGRSSWSWSSCERCGTTDPGVRHEVVMERTETAAAPTTYPFRSGRNRILLSGRLRRRSRT